MSEFSFSLKFLPCCEKFRVKNKEQDDKVKALIACGSIDKLYENDRNLILENYPQVLEYVIMHRSIDGLR